MPASQLFSPAPVTTLTLFRLKPGNVRWGLAQMGPPAQQVRKTEGLIFGHLLGSGSGSGFSILPDFQVYGFLGSWTSQEMALPFFRNSDFIKKYQDRCSEIYTLFLQPYQAHGLWDGQNPFKDLVTAPTSPMPIAVLTRAAIRWQALPGFWKHVPAASKALDQAEGLLLSKGLGELPIIRQATFSLWTSEEAMKAYAYRLKDHKEVIRRTRQDNWYSEELFARFTPFNSEGSWGGKDPLEFLLR